MSRGNLTLLADITEVNRNCGNSKGSNVCKVSVLTRKWSQEGNGWGDTKEGTKANKSRSCKVSGGEGKKSVQSLSNCSEISDEWSG